MKTWECWVDIAGQSGHMTFESARPQKRQRELIIQITYLKKKQVAGGKK